MDNMKIVPFNKPKAIPIYTYVILLKNGKTVEQRASTWIETADDEGAGIAYYFYQDKVRVLSLEYGEVRAVLCSEMCDVKAVLAAMTPPKKRKVSK